MKFCEQGASNASWKGYKKSPSLESFHASLPPSNSLTNIFHCHIYFNARLASKMHCKSVFVLAVALVSLGAAAPVPGKLLAFTERPHAANQISAS